MAAAAWGGKIYLFGGVSEGKETDDTLIYDPSTDRWSTGAPLPTAREHLGAAVIGNTIYVTGGRSLAGRNASSLDAYSPETNTWRTLKPMGFSRSGHGTAAMGNKLYVFGGEDLLTRGVLPQVEEYDSLTDTWREVARLPNAVTGPGTVNLAGAIHIMGGSGSSGGTGATHLVFRFP